MGKGFNNYMCKKFFHPASRDNLKRVWMAEQKAESYKKKQEELRVQYEKEQDLYTNKAMLSKESKDKLSVNFMYEPPPGTKKEREREDDEPEYKFEWQRKFNAPREDYCKGDSEIRDQPFGIQVRNVRCIKCHKWGHINTDKECPMYNQSSSTDQCSSSMDPMLLVQQMREDGLAMKQSALGLHLAGTEHMHDSDDDNKLKESEIEFLKSLSKKQKQKLLKKFKQFEKRKREKRKKKAKKDDKREDSVYANSRDDLDDKRKLKKHKKERSKKHREVKCGSSSSSSSSDSELSTSDNSEDDRRKHSKSKKNGKLRKVKNESLCSADSDSGISGRDSYEDRNRDHSSKYKKWEGQSTKEKTIKREKMSSSSESDAETEHKAVKSAHYFKERNYKSASLNNFDPKGKCENGIGIQNKQYSYNGVSNKGQWSEECKERSRTKSSGESSDSYSRRKRCSSDDSFDDDEHQSKKSRGVSSSREKKSSRERSEKHEKAFQKMKNSRHR